MWEVMGEGERWWVDGRERVGKSARMEEGVGARAGEWERVWEKIE